MRWAVHPFSQGGIPQCRGLNSLNRFLIDVMSYFCKGCMGAVFLTIQACTMAWQKPFSHFNLGSCGESRALLRERFVWVYGIVPEPTFTVQSSSTQGNAYQQKCSTALPRSLGIFPPLFSHRSPHPKDMTFMSHVPAAHSISRA